MVPSLHVIVWQSESPKSWCLMKFQRHLHGRRDSSACCRIILLQLVKHLHRLLPPAPSAESRGTPLVGAAAFPRVSPAVISLREYSDLYVLQKLKKKIVSLLRPLPEPYVSERSIGVWPIVRSFVTSLCEQLDVSVTRFIDRVIVCQPQKVLDWILPPGWNAVTEFERRQAE